MKQVKQVTRWTILLAVMGMAMLVAGCGQGTATESAETSTIEALVPCGQVGPFSEIVRLFEEEHPDVTVEWVPENIVTITSKVIDGVAQPDVFMSMGDLEMDQVEEEGLVVEGTRTQYAANSLAIMVPTGNPAGVRTIADLVKPEVEMIAIPNPEENSVGKHAVEAIRAAGIWDRVEDRILYPRFAADGKDVIAQNRVQVSIGYYPCAVEVHVPGEEPATPRNIELVGQVSPELYDSFYCEGAVIKGSPNPEGGRMLLEFMTTPEAQVIFEKWSFTAESVIPEGE